MQVAGIVLANMAVLWLLHRYHDRGWQLPRRTWRRTAATLFCLLGVVELGFAYSVHTGQENILAAADAIPFHLKSGASKLFKRLGVEPRGKENMRLAGGEVVYPAEPVDSSKVRPDNVIILVAESFRWDLLDPEITPTCGAFPSARRVTSVTTAVATVPAWACSRFSTVFTHPTGTALKSSGCRRC